MAPAAGAAPAAKPAAAAPAAPAAAAAPAPAAAAGKAAPAPPLMPVASGAGEVVVTKKGKSKGPTVSDFLLLNLITDDHVFFKEDSRSIKLKQLIQ